MNHAQTWILIGGFFALVTASTGLLLRTVRAEIGVLGARFDTVDAKFDTVDARFDAIDARLGNLDRAMHAVVTRLMDS